MPYRYSLCERVYYLQLLLLLIIYIYLIIIRKISVYFTIKNDLEKKCNNYTNNKKQKNALFKCDKNTFSKKLNSWGLYIGRGACFFARVDNNTHTRIRVIGVFSALIEGRV